jgi:hypothetical protein
MASGDSNGEAGCGTSGSPKCILDKYYAANTDTSWLESLELYNYQLAYKTYDVNKDPNLSGAEKAIIAAPMLRAGVANGSLASAIALVGISAMSSPGLVSSHFQVGSQSKKDLTNLQKDIFGDPDCVGCGYSYSSDVPTWSFGANKSDSKWQNQMSQRGWTSQQITSAIKFGSQFPAKNNINPNNPATRYVHPVTGRSVVVDEVTNEIIHIGGNNYGY